MQWCAKVNLFHCVICSEPSPFYGKRNFFVVLTGYFDESSHKDVFTLCCSISNPTGWSEISRNWMKCIDAKNKSLRCQGRPPISLTIPAMPMLATTSSRNGNAKNGTSWLLS